MSSIPIAVLSMVGRVVRKLQLQLIPVKILSPLIPFLLAIAPFISEADRDPSDETGQIRAGSSVDDFLIGGPNCILPSLLVSPLPIIHIQHDDASLSPRVRNLSFR